MARGAESAGQGESSEGELWPAGEADALMARLKAALLDRRWAAAESACADYLKRFPDSPHAAAVTFQRGRALSSLGSRDLDALEAYEQAGQRAGAGTTLAREARRAACGVAWDLASTKSGESAARRQGRSTLTECLRHADRSVRVYAAVVASRIDDEVLRGEAARVLTNEMPAETDRGLRDEMALALARIDPAAATGSVERSPRAGGPARWIHLRITKRSRPDDRVEINLPIAFARALLDSLPENARSKLRAQAEGIGLSWEALSSALADLEAADEPLLSVDDGDEKIEVWVD